MSRKQEQEWLDSLKPGDPVVVSYRGTLTAKKVDRRTKAQIILEGGDRFRADGLAVGNSASYWTRKIVESTVERAEEIARGKLVWRLRNQAWTALTLDQLERIHAITQEKPTP